MSVHAGGTRMAARGPLDLRRQPTRVWGVRVGLSEYVIQGFTATGLIVLFLSGRFYRAV